MKKTQTKRSWGTTATAVILGLAVIALILPLVPLNNLAEITVFVFGTLLVVLCAIVAISGKKGTIKDIIYSLSFWP